MTNVHAIRRDLPPVPVAIDAEQALLGGLLVHNAMFHPAAEIIGAEDFSDHLHAAVWRYAARMVEEGRSASPFTIAPLLQGVDIGGMTPAQYLGHLAAEGCIPSMVVDYALTIKEMAVRRRLIAVSEAIDANARNVAGVAPSKALATALADLDHVRARIDAGKAADRGMAGDFARAYVEHLQDRVAGRAPDNRLLTGLSDLDDMVGGFQRSGVTILAGRPAMGKTSVAIDLAMRLAEAGHRGAFFSIEMGAEQIMPRLIARRAVNTGPRMDFSRVMRGHISGNELQRVADASEQISTMPLFLDVVSSPTVSEIQSRSRAAEAFLGGPPEFVVVDYLGLVASSQRYQGQRSQEIGEISRGLKSLMKTSGAAGIVLCQMSRKNEDRADKRPELSDLRDSGEIEQDAEAVIFAFREAYYLQNKTDAESQAKLLSCRNQIDLIVEKNRHGPTGTVKAFCDLGTSFIDNLGSGY